MSDAIERASDNIVMTALRLTIADLQAEMKVDIVQQALRGHTNRALLVECLPYLRTTEARGLRTRVIAALEASQKDVPR